MTKVSLKNESRSQHTIFLFYDFFEFLSSSHCQCPMRISPRGEVGVLREEGKKSAEKRRELKRLLSFKHKRHPLHVLFSPLLVAPFTLNTISRTAKESNVSKEKKYLLFFFLPLETQRRIIHAIVRSKKISRDKKHAWKM